jgi:hypothetical protein
MRIRFRRPKGRTAANPPGPSLRQQFPDVPDDVLAILESVRPYTMTSPQRLMALCDAVSYVSRQKVPGDIVECGVWRGGSMMAAALILGRHEDWQRCLWLYDTFDGMSEPAECDEDYAGNAARQLLAEQDKFDTASVWCWSPLEQVRKNLATTGYPAEQIRFVPGRVEDTIPSRLPDRISLLRLDTDWYASTRHELEHLYPRLSHGGVLIIDDYGHWQGCRRAVDEYFANRGIRILLNRIDYTGRIAIKADPLPPRINRSEQAA